MASLVRLIEQVYCPPRARRQWSFEQLVGHGEIRYFSYGRHALREALLAIGVRPGEAILLPGYICRDLLAAIHSVGGVPLYFQVGERLQMESSPDDLPVASAIIAVNYFGFPQDLTPFREYCRRTGAALIEDNAHGLFSRDEGGALLGARGDMGIFSLRKTVPLPDGAALLVTAANKSWKLPAQLPLSNARPSRPFRIKRLLRQMVPWVGTAVPRGLTKLERMLRKLRTGYEIAPPAADAEWVMPESAAPCQELPETLADVDIEREVIRRRELYLALEPVICAGGGEPVFDNLPLHTSPYGFPFRCEEGQTGKIRGMLGEMKLECHKWPDLPGEIAPGAPGYYKSVWLVSFVW